MSPPNHHHRHHRQNCRHQDRHHHRYRKTHNAKRSGRIVGLLALLTIPSNHFFLPLPLYIKGHNRELVLVATIKPFFNIQRLRYAPFPPLWFECVRNDACFNMTLAHSLVRSHRSLTCSLIRSLDRSLIRSLASGKVATYERPAMRRCEC